MIWFWIDRFRPARSSRRGLAYCPDQRLSNEFDGTTGWDPEIIAAEFAADFASGLGVSGLAAGAAGAGLTGAKAWAVAAGAAAVVAVVRGSGLAAGAEPAAIALFAGVDPRKAMAGAAVLGAGAAIAGVDGAAAALGAGTGA